VAIIEHRNVGAFIAPFITAAWVGAAFGMKWGFFAAAIGMILCTLFLQIAKKHLGKIGRALAGTVPGKFP
jgi:dipeptide/tripeptide permease